MFDVSATHTGFFSPPFEYTRLFFFLKKAEIGKQKTSNYVLLTTCVISWGYIALRSAN